jgi:hypothetical protein
MSDTLSNSPDVSDITAACQTVVEDCIAGKIELVAVPENLKAIEITPEAAQDYIEQITQRIGEKKTGFVQNILEGSREATPEGLSDDDREEFLVSERSLLKRVIGETKEKSNSERTRLLHGLYLP